MELYSPACLIIIIIIINNCIIIIITTTYFSLCFNPLYLAHHGAQGFGLLLDRKNWAVKTN